MKRYKRYDEGSYISKVHAGTLVTDEFLKKIKKLTSKNNHGEAYEEVAKFFGMKNLEKIFSYINFITDIEGSLPTNLSKYRYEKYKQLLSAIKIARGEDEMKQVYEVL